MNDREEWQERVRDIHATKHDMMMMIDINATNLGSPHGVVAKVLDWDILVSEFEPESHYCIRTRTNILKKGLNPFISSLCYGLNHITTDLLQG